ncbi:MAG: hypothetical protein Q9187_006176 [Circinaria calcarea]
MAALRKLGVRCVVAFSAVGSLKEEVRPRDFLVPDQVFDRTKGVRPWTYFEGGVVGHVGFADPFDNELRDIIVQAVHGKGVLKGEDVRIHDQGTLVCMEGPQFSTRFESIYYRSLSCSAINMSVLPEAKLAREAELAYAMICMSTDYDSWHDTNESVSVEMVMGHMKANSENACHVVAAVLDELGREERESVVGGEKWKGQTGGAVGITKVEGRSEDVVRKLGWLFPEYFGRSEGGGEDVGFKGSG